MATISSHGLDTFVEGLRNNITTVECWTNSNYCIKQYHISKPITKEKTIHARTRGIFLFFLNWSMVRRLEWNTVRIGKSCHSLQTIRRRSTLSPHSVRACHVWPKNLQEWMAHVAEMENADQQMNAMNMIWIWHDWICMNANRIESPISKLLTNSYLPYELHPIHYKTGWCLPHLGRIPKEHARLKDDFSLDAKRGDFSGVQSWVNADVIHVETWHENCKVIANFHAWFF